MFHFYCSGFYRLSPGPMELKQDNQLNNNLENSFIDFPCFQTWLSQVIHWRSDSSKDSRKDSVTINAIINLCDNKYNYKSQFKNANEILKLNMVLHPQSVAIKTTFNTYDLSRIIKLNIIKKFSYSKLNINPNTTLKTNLWTPPNSYICISIKPGAHLPR